MNKKMLLNASLLALLAVLLTFGVAFAHEHVPVGNYELVIGWAQEPTITGQPNAITVRVEDTTAPDREVDASKLTASIAYGGETKPLSLEKSFGTTNEYEAHIIPTIAGEYTVQLRGKIEDTDVNVDVQPEEVTSPDALAFPAGQGGQGQRGGFGGGGFGGAFGLTTWLSGGALLVSLVALVLGILALRKSRS